MRYNLECSKYNNLGNLITKELNNLNRKDILSHIDVLLSEGYMNFNVSKIEELYTVWIREQFDVIFKRIIRQNGLMLGFSFIMPHNNEYGAMSKKEAKELQDIALNSDYPISEITIRKVN